MLQTVRRGTWRSDIYRAPGPIRIAGQPAGLYLSTLGRFVSSGRFVFEQVSPDVALHFVLAGRGVMENRGRKFAVGPGDVFAFFPTEHYRYHDAPESPWRYVWLNFEGPDMPMALKHVDITRQSPLVTRRDPRGLETLFEEIQRTFAEPSVPASAAVAFAWRILASLERPAAEIPPQSPAEAARFLIERQTMAVSTVDELAAELGLSRSSLFRHFRAAYGISPKQHIDAVRLARAQQLLRQSDATLKEIAAACGYASSQYFIRVFTRQMKTSPGKWRKSAQRANA